MSYITMGELDRVRLSALSWTPQYRTVLSWDLLAWVLVKDRIYCSFTNFITTPELSGPFYIDPDNYHTQITEYLLEKFYKSAFFSLHQTSSNRYSVRSSSSSLYHSFFNLDWTFREHLSYALPTENIFYLLRSIHYSVESPVMLNSDSLEIIIKWLQVSVSEMTNCSN